MPVSVEYVSKLTVTEYLTDALLEENSSVVHNGLDKEETLNAISAVPVTQNATFEKAMTSGAATIDLRALVGTNAGAVDGNGLKVNAIKLVNKSTNANAITIVGGASSGYLLFGTAGSIVLSPGDEILCRFKDSRPDIDSTHKTIDISGTGSQVLQVEVVMG